MAEQRRTNPSRRPAPRSRAPQRRRQAPARKKNSGALPALLSRLAPKTPEFRPDNQGGGWKGLQMTRLQRLTYLKWLLYIFSMIVLLVIQDVIMSRMTLFGGTTDLVAGAILLVTVMEGTEVGSLFVLLSSLLYYFSGSSPGPYSVMLLTFVGIGASMFRQMYYHRSRGSICLCAGVALVLYELATYGVALFQERTRWDRIGIFLAAGLLTWIVLIPLYSLYDRIGQIGGNTWKE